MESLHGGKQCCVGVLQVKVGGQHHAVDILFHDGIQHSVAVQTADEVVGRAAGLHVAL